MSAHQSPPYHPTLVNLRTAPLEEIDAALRHWRGWRITVWTPDEPTETPTEPAPADAELGGMWEQADLIDTSEAPPPKPAPAPDPTRILAEDLDAAYHANNEALRRVQALTPGVHIPQTRTRTRPTTTAKDQAYKAVRDVLKAEVARQGWDHGIEHPYLVLVGSNISPRDFEPFDMPALFAALAAPPTTPTTPDSPRIPLDAITGIPTTPPTPPTPTQRPPAPTEANETGFPGMVLPVNADKRLTEAIRLIALANKAPDNDSAIGHTLRALAQVISTIAVPRCCEGGPQWGHAWTCDTLP